MEKEQRQKRSPDYAIVEPPRFRWKSFLIANGSVTTGFVVLFAIIFLVVDPSENESPLVFIVVSLTSGIFYGSLGYFVALVTRKFIFAARKVDQLRDSSEDLQVRLEEDFVTNLVRIIFKYIDAYYLQTRLQADKSFTFSVFAAVTSLLLIIAGISFSFFGQIESAAVAAGAGILGEFISMVFFYLYNQTVAKMADYHRKLVFTQNIGLALKISDGLPAEEKTRAQLGLIETLSTNINQYLST